VAAVHSCLRDMGLWYIWAVPTSSWSYSGYGAIRSLKTGDSSVGIQSAILPSATISPYPGPSHTAHFNQLRSGKFGQREGAEICCSTKCRLTIIWALAVPHNARPTCSASATSIPQLIVAVLDVVRHRHEQLHAKSRIRIPRAESG
jgi:hypothetical protein